MERLEKLVFVHYNMRLRQRTLTRKQTEQDSIDLNNIFHEEDPLGEWIREREDCLLDDRDNPWLDEAIAEDEALGHNAATERRRKGKHAATTEETESQNSPRDDDSDDSSGNGPVYTHGSPTNTSWDQSQDQIYSHGQHRGHQYFGMDDTHTGVGRHDAREEPSDSEGAFDGMMSSFFGGTQISHYYPHEPQRYYPHEPQPYPPPFFHPHEAFQQLPPDQDNDTQNLQLEPHRYSFWW